MTDQEHYVKFGLYHPDFVNANSNDYNIELKDSFGNHLEATFSLIANLPIMQISVYVGNAQFDYLLLNITCGEHLMDICPLEVRFNDVSSTTTVDTPCFIRKREVVVDENDTIYKPTLSEIVCVVDLLPEPTEDIPNNEFEYVMDVVVKVTPKINKNLLHSTIDDITEHMTVHPCDSFKLVFGFNKSFLIDVNVCVVYNLLFKVHSQFHTNMTITEISDTCVKVSFLSNNSGDLFIEVGANDHFIPSKSISISFNDLVETSSNSSFDIIDDKNDFHVYYDELNLIHSNEKNDKFYVDNPTIRVSSFEASEEKQPSNISVPVDNLCIFLNGDSYKRAIDNGNLKLLVPKFISAMSSAFHWTYFHFGGFFSKLNLSHPNDHFVANVTKKDDQIVFKLSQSINPLS